MRLDLKSLPPLARYTWRRHWPAQVWLGLAEGAFGLATFAALRSLDADKWVAPALVTVSQVPWLLTPVWERWLGSVDPRKAFRTLAWMSFASLAVIAFVDVTPVGDKGEGVGNLGLFICGIMLGNLIFGAYLSHRSALIRTNYVRAVRGRVFGWLVTVSRVSSVVSAKVAGFLLDSDPRWLRAVFPLVGVCLFAEQMLLGRIRWRRTRQERLARPQGSWFIDSVRRSWQVLRRDRPFMIYETGFMLYGLGFLMSIPMIYVFGESGLGVSYDEWTWAQGVSFPVAMIAALPAFGWLTDRIGTVRTTAVSFLVLAGFFCCVPFVHDPLTLVAAFAVWGVAMAGVMVVWNLGPLHFAPDGQGRTYASVHVFMVGARSVVAPALGYALAALTSLRVVFLASALLVALGAAVVWTVRVRNR